MTKALEAAARHTEKAREVVNSCVRPTYIAPHTRASLVTQVATALAEAEQAGIKRAAEIAENHMFLKDIDRWMASTKREASAFSCLSVRDAILSALENGNGSDN